MAFSEKISVILDLDGKSFLSSLRSVRTQVSQTDGFFNKLKTGVGGLKASFSEAAKSPAVMGAAMAGAAVVAVSAANAFSDVAKAALDLSTSTGLSTEEASRWIAVGDDFEVSAEALATGLGKVAKTLDDTKWAKYGIETRDAAGHARSANDILLDSLDTLSKVRNETERARIGQELFGKGYQSITPILGHTRAEYEKMLAAVEKGQVITAEEAEAAEKWRLGMDQLGDTLKDLQLQVGEAVAGFAPLLTAASNAIVKLNTLGGIMPEDGSILQAAIAGGTLNNFDRDLGSLADAAERLSPPIDNLEGATRGLGAAAIAAADAAQNEAVALWEADRASRVLGHSTGALVADVADLAPEFQGIRHDAHEFAGSLHEVLTAYTDLTEAISDERTYLELQQSFRDVQTAGEEAMAAVAEGSMTAEEAAESQRLEILDLQDEVIAYGEKYDEIPREVITDILADLDQGKLDEAKMKLAEVEKQRNVKIWLDTVEANRKLAELERRFKALNLGIGGREDPNTGGGSGTSFGQSNGDGSGPTGIPEGLGIVASRNSTALVVSNAREESRAVEQSTEDKLAAEAELLRRKLYYGEITREEFLAGLRTQTEGLDKYSDYAFEINKEIADMEDRSREEAADALEKAIKEFEDGEDRKRKAAEETAALVKKLADEAEADRKRRIADQDEAVDNAELIRDQRDAVDELTWAQAELEKVMRDRKATDEDRARAIRDVEEAQTRLAKATVAGAAARANQAGFADGTDAYFAFIKDALTKYISAHPELSAAAIEILTSGAARASIPSFDAGGVVPGRKGSAQMILAHGGETVLPTHKSDLNGATNNYYFNLHTGADPNSVIRVVKQAQKRGEI